MNKINHCSNCGRKRVIVNKKYNLCDECNKERLRKNALKSPQMPSKPLSHKKNTKVPKRINNRSEKLKQGIQLYNETKAKKAEYLKEHNKLRCVFCNAELKDEYEWHHLLGRRGKLLYEWDNISPVHRRCHREYHDLDAHKLIKLKWYPSFLHRIKTIALTSGKQIFIKLHNKEMYRLFKAGIYDHVVYFKELIEWKK